MECSNCGATLSLPTEGRSREQTQHVLINQLTGAKSASLQHNVHEIAALSEETIFVESN